jgi:hypothetical protein
VRTREEKSEGVARASKGQEVKVVPEVLEAKARKTEDSRDRNGDASDDIAPSRQSREWRFEMDSNTPD